MFVNDKLEGISKKYYKNGKLSKETPYKDGKREGVQKSYYDSGELKYKRPIKNEFCPVLVSCK